MGMNKMKRKLKALVLTLMLLIGAGASGAYSAYYSVNAGCAPNQAPYTTPLGFSTFGTVKDSTGASLASGKILQYINASGNLIVGPHSDGSIGGSESLAQTYSVGDDADKYHSFSSLAGKFYHGITGQTGVNYFYVRAWDGDPTLAGSKFGESQIFSATTNPDTPPVPNEIALSDFQAMYPKSAPATPTNLGVSPISYNTATATFNASFGARSYQISWGLDASATGSTAPLGNSQQFPSPNSTDPKTIGMSGLSDDTDYWVKVEAINSFGTSAYSSSYHFKTNRLPDLTPPQTVTDLRIRDFGGSAGTFIVTLEWTAPYDADRLGTHVNVSGYDIRYSSDPILASTLEGFTDWFQATSIDPTFATPAPIAFGSTQEVTITGLSAGFKAFALQSKDTTPNWSAMSNVTAAQLGAPAGGYTGLSTIEQGWSIIAAGQGLPMTLGNSNLYESGAQTGDQSTADMIYQYIPNTTNYNVAYLDLSHNWIDVNTGTSATWEIEPDKGYFYKRKPATPLTWGVRPKP
jgi:hypothetical protein